MKINEVATMLRKYVAAPRTTGTVCPSSKYLARRMVKYIGFQPDGERAVAELGSGTGAITEYIVKGGYDRGGALFCIEFDSRLSELLSEKFSTAKVLNGSAEDIRKLIGAEASARLGAIISGLPLLSLPKDCVRRIISEVEESLPAGGRFVQFTYNLNRNPESLGFKKMRHVCSSRVYLNIPPARVDVFEKLP